MDYYRIQIEESNNGKKLYVPQVGKLVIKNKLFRQTQEIKWYNILQYGGRFELSTTIKEWCYSEEKALSIINGHKGIDEYEEENKIKSITYKMID
jgi:hypothetical protein